MTYGVREARLLGEHRLLQRSAIFGRSLLSFKSILSATGPNINFGEDDSNTAKLIARDWTPEVARR